MELEDEISMSLGKLVNIDHECHQTEVGQELLGRQLHLHIDFLS